MEMEKEVTLDGLIHTLAIKRHNEAKCKAEIKDLEEQIVKTELGQQLAQARKRLETATILRKVREEEARALAVQRHINGEEQHPAIHAVKRQTFLLYDEMDAIKWAAQFYPAAVSLKKRPFEKYARAVMETAPLKFVSVARAHSQHQERPITLVAQRGR